jgi:hypothetical protein
MYKKLGRIEKVNFIDISGKLDAKVDTGAWRTSLHVDDIYIKDGDLHFHINNNVYNYKSYKKVKVKSSFGETQVRYSIKTRIIIGDLTYIVSITLSNRNNMKYKCLIGRKFLRDNKFLVDVSKEYINYDRCQKM